jgi:alkanesulfonate monooxygenase SsuD/methylene tetrahydromethanopterin reductase-like flavin-dependent oxidoreductase (luciferase family)
VGSPETVRSGLQQIVDQTGADELIFSGQIFDHQKRLRSFEIGAEAARQVTLSKELALV